MSCHCEGFKELCNECKQNVAETQKIRKKFEKLKKKYTNLCVRFAESQVQYNDLLKVNGVNKVVSNVAISNCNRNETNYVDEAKH